MRLLSVLLLSTALAVGCASDQEAYCETVEEHQTELTEILAAGGPQALLDALPVYRDLQAEAPSDIADEWQQVVRSLEGLQQALEDADVDPAAYDPKRPPAGVSKDEVEAIAAAADQVGSAETQRALRGVEQQARDVCHTPLML